MSSASQACYHENPAIEKVRQAMSLLKFFWSDRDSKHEREINEPAADRAIAAMSQRELADLPSTFPAPQPTRYELPRLSRCA